MINYAITYAFQSDTGKQRTHNEDFVAALGDEHVFVVADGMGGHAMGELASELAVTNFCDSYKTISAENIKKRVTESILAANFNVYEMAKKNEKYKGMGTTIVCAAFDDTSVCIAHVGDSRLYRLRNNTLQCLTRDHSLLESYKEAHPNLTPEEEFKFNRKNVLTRAVGVERSVSVEVVVKKVQEKDRYLLCSDGLNTMVSAERLEEIIREADPQKLQKCVDALIFEANRNGGRDNISAIVIAVEPKIVVAVTSKNQ